MTDCSVSCVLANPIAEATWCCMRRGTTGTGAHHYHKSSSTKFYKAQHTQLGQGWKQTSKSVEKYATCGSEYAALRLSRNQAVISQCPLHSKP